MATGRAGASPLGFVPPALVVLEAEHYDAVLNKNNNFKIQPLCSIRQLQGHLALLNQFGFCEGSTGLLCCSPSWELAASGAQ